MTDAERLATLKRLHAERDALPRSKDLRIGQPNVEAARLVAVPIDLLRWATEKVRLPNDASEADRQKMLDLRMGATRAKGREPPAINLHDLDWLLARLMVEPRATEPVADSHVPADRDPSFETLERASDNL